MLGLHSAHEHLPDHAQAGAQEVGQLAQSVGDLGGDVLAAGGTDCGCWFAGEDPCHDDGRLGHQIN